MRSVIEQLARGFDQSRVGDHAERTAEGDPRDPHGEEISRRGSSWKEQHIEGSVDRVDDPANVGQVTQPRRIQNIGARFLKALQTRDGVGEIGIASDVVLRARRQHERRWISVCGGDRGPNSVDRVVAFV